MGVELFEKSYYDEVYRSKNYIDMTTACKVAVNDYISHIFFGGDASRLVYSDPEYAFRDRIESLAKGVDDDSGIFLNNLQLPFASYFLTTKPEIIKSASSSELYGYYLNTHDDYIHFYNTKRQCQVQLWFNNYNDAEAAYRIALTESHSQYPIRYEEKIYWRNRGIGIPVNILIKKITYGLKSFTKSEWLKTSKMFPMLLDLELETAEIHLNKGVGAVQLPYKWRLTGNPDTWTDDSTIYYTTKSVLEFSTRQYNVQFNPGVDNVIKQQVSMLKGIKVEGLDDETVEAVSRYLPSPDLCTMVRGTFKENTLVRFQKLAYNEKKTTIDEKGRVTAHIDFRIRQSSYDDWKICQVVVPAHETLYIKSCKETELKIPGLYPNSHYTIYFITEDLSGNENTVPLEFTTPVWEKETLAVFDGTAESINNRVNTDPKEVPINGLISKDNAWTNMEM